MSTKHPHPLRFLQTSESFAVSCRFHAWRAQSRFATVAVWLAGAGAFASQGCSKDTFQSSAATEDDDRPKLAALLAADAKVDAVLSDADRLDRQGKPAEAAKLVEVEATSALAEAKVLLGRTTIQTAWGKERQSEVERLFADRSSAMPSYAASFRAQDPKAKLEALLVQAALEKRALAIASSTKRKEASP